MAKRIIFTGKAEVTLEQFDPRSPGEGEVRIATSCTLMSTGTENIVFNRLFEAGTGWDRWVSYPFKPGYSAVGVVTELGSGVTNLTVGQRVVCRQTHASEHVSEALKCYPVPEGISDEDASWFALAKIAAMGARVADVRLGERVVVIGAGPIGQMALRWAAAAGAGQLIVVDPFAARLGLATSGGADHVIGRPIGEAIE